MEREVAEQVLKKSKEATDDLILALAPYEKTCSQEELKELKMGLGRAVVAIAEHIHKPIYIKHPDLIPVELRAKDGGLPYFLR